MSIQAGPGGFGPGLACGAAPPLSVLIIALGSIIAPAFRPRTE